MSGQPPFFRVVVGFTRHRKWLIPEPLPTARRIQAQGVWIDLLDQLAQLDPDMQMHRRGLVTNVELHNLYGGHWRRSRAIVDLANHRFIHLDPDGAWVHEHVEHQDLNRRASVSRERSLAAKARWEREQERHANASNGAHANASRGEDANAASANADAEVTEVYRTTTPTPGEPARDPTPTPQPIRDYATGDRDLARQLAVIAINHIPIAFPAIAAIEKAALDRIQQYPASRDTHIAAMNWRTTTPEGRYWDTDDNPRAATHMVAFAPVPYGTALSQMEQNSRQSPTSKPLTPEQEAKRNAW